MIGLGTQDSLGEAEDFVDEYGTTFPMLWDESFRSWIEIGVSSQPTAVFLSPGGTILTGWVDPFPEDSVLELADEFSA